MKAHQSPLILNSFLLLNHKYHFLEPKNEIPGNVIEVMNSYHIDIDFVLHKNDEELYQLFTKIEINHIDKPLPGYRLFIEGVSVFSFDKSIELTEQNKSSLLHYSGLNICINSLRNILSTITSHGPFGKYTLPSIDVNKLLDDKKEQVRERKN